MRFHILDVGHGFCSYAAANNGNVIMFDCGRKSDGTGFPTDVLRRQRCTGVERLIITNYDEDHINDLPNLREHLSIQILHRNKSISTDQLRALKREGGPISAAMESLLQMMDYYSSPVTDEPEFPGISWESFHAKYGTDFDDTNNISLVTFLTCGALRVVIPGDLEEPGWLHHLKSARFRELLSTVDVFVASHHGRESGYCKQVFDHCNPDVIVFSDSPIVHGTQEMANTYATHASGITFNGQTRYVLSTRNDGDIVWNDL